MSEPLAPWPLHRLEPLDITVGPCAWQATMLAGPHADFVRRRPSLIVVGPDEDDEMLRAVAPQLAGRPVMLAIREPSFARRLGDLIRAKLQCLALPRVEILTLWVDQIMDLKGGSMLQTLQACRERGLARNIGLALRDSRDAEWAATHTSVRLVALPYHLADQSARYRALETIEQYGMAALALGPAGDDRLRPAAEEESSLRFALVESRRALPLLDRPIPAELAPMDAAEVERRWQDFRAAHEAPTPLPRGSPPEGAG